MPHYPTWDYVPVLHDFEYIATVPWPGRQYEQLDWILGVHEIEMWLNDHNMHKYSHWAWNMGIEVYTISVAFRWDKHRTLFLLQWA